jgi:hypothetical protein
LPTVRSDLRLAYLFTGLFGMALVVIAAGVHPDAAGGSRIAVEIAARLESVAGPLARWVFLVGFWCTVFTAMLGVWQGVPQVYADLVTTWRARSTPPTAESGATADGGVAAEDGTAGGRTIYLAAVAYLAGPPLVLLWHREPVGVVVTFSIAGAFFMPFLAATLLHLNNRREWVGALANRWPGNTALIVCLVVFGAVCVREVLRALV